MQFSALLVRMAQKFLKKVEEEDLEEYRYEMIDKISYVAEEQQRCTYTERWVIDEALSEP